MATSIVDVHQLGKLRPLGAIEQFSSARHHIGFYNNVGITASYTHLSQDPIHFEDAIFSAIAVVINRHPILSAIPIDEDSNAPYFARLPTIDLEEVVAFLIRQRPTSGNGTDAELDQILQEQHNRNFKERYGELPFWRLIILTNPAAGRGIEFTASFIFHHALGDGGSGMIFHKAFLSALQSNPAPFSSPIVFPPKSELLPNLEAILPLPITPSTPASLLPGLWSGAPISLPMLSNFKSLAITASTTKAYLAACRKNGTTLTATIPVLIASVLSELLPERYTDFESCIPVSLRRFLRSPYTNTEEMGVLIDAFSQFYTRSTLTSGFSWDEARRSKSVIGEYLKTGGEKVNVARLQGVLDMRAMFLNRIGKERGSSFDVSNLGGLGTNVNEEEEGKGKEEVWKMGRMVFSRSAFGAGSAFSTGLVTGADGCLVLGFAWQEGIVEADLMMAVVENVSVGIEGIAREEFDV